MRIESFGDAKESEGSAARELIFDHDDVGGLPLMLLAVAEGPDENTLETAFDVIEDRLEERIAGATLDPPAVEWAEELLSVAHTALRRVGGWAAMTLALVHRGSCYVAHVGAGRFYLLREDSLHQVTEDQDGPAEVRWLGGEDKPIVETAVFDVQKTDRVLAISREVHESILRSDIEGFAMQSEDPKGLVQRLLKASNGAVVAASSEPPSLARVFSSGDLKERWPWYAGAGASLVLALVLGALQLFGPDEAQAAPEEDDGTFVSAPDEQVVEAGPAPDLRTLEPNERMVVLIRRSGGLNEVRSTMPLSVATESRDANPEEGASTTFEATVDPGIDPERELGEEEAMVIVERFETRYRVTPRGGFELFLDRQPLDPDGGSIRTFDATRDKPRVSWYLDEGRSGVGSFNFDRA